MPQKIKSARKQLVFHSTIALFFLACVLLGIICLQYYRKLQFTIREESGDYLQEVSWRIESNISRIINDNYAVLQTMESVLKNAGASSFADVQPVVDAQKNYWNYEDIMLVDENGTAYNSQGKEVMLGGDVYLRNVTLDKKQTMSMSELIDNQERIIFAIPLNNMQIGGKTMVALAASYDPDTFDEVLAMSSFGGEAYCQIIEKDGSIIVRSTSEKALKTGYNVLTSIEESTPDEGDSFTKMRADIQNNHAGQIGFTMDGVRTYMVYTPIDTEDWFLLTFVPTSVVNARSDLMLRITLMACGLITFVFAGLSGVLFFSSYNHRRKLEQIAYVDQVTKGNTIQRFYELAGEALTVQDRPNYALVYTNFEKFKVLNEQFGERACDMMLQAYCQVITNSLSAGEHLGRLTADNFCILLKCPEDETLLGRFEGWYRECEAYIEQNSPVWSLPITEYGIYIITNDTMPFPQMIDRAKLALRKSPHSINSKVRYGIYDDEVRRHLVREKQLEDVMEQALAQNEFQVYLQPKYRTSDLQIGGAEALVRWKSSLEGMIYPDEFIPLFESNGFIIPLDLWVFEQVCKTLRSWLDQGRKPMKISVNCSRVHIKDPLFLNAYFNISERYQIPKKLIEIELTESVVMEDTQRLSKIIDDIHGFGFGCSMDDFGSGYSSLNLIQDIPVDTLKLDKIFFRNGSKDAKRLESVVGSIVTMAKALSMETVAEGVEYQDQVEMLCKIGCDYIQGFVFAKPMPIEAFENLAFEDDSMN